MALPEYDTDQIVVVIDAVRDGDPPDPLFWRDYLAVLLADDGVIAVRVYTDPQTAKAAIR